jgi:hypothetical protein
MPPETECVYLLQSLNNHLDKSGVEVVTVLLFVSTLIEVGPNQILDRDAQDTL